MKTLYCALYKSWEMNVAVFSRLVYIIMFLWLLTITVVVVSDAICIRP